MNLLPKEQITLTDGTIIKLRDIAALQHGDTDQTISHVRVDNYLMSLQGDNASRVMALVIGDIRMTLGEDTEILTTKGYKRVYSIVVGDAIPHMFPTPLYVNEIRRVVGKVLTYVCYTSTGVLKLSNGVTIKTHNSVELVPGEKERLDAVLKNTETTDG